MRKLIMTAMGLLLAASASVSHAYINANNKTPFCSAVEPDSTSFLSHTTGTINNQRVVNGQYVVTVDFRLSAYCRAFSWNTNHMFAVSPKITWPTETIRDIIAKIHTDPTLVTSSVSSIAASNSAIASPNNETANAWLLIERHIHLGKGLGDPWAAVPRSISDQCYRQKWSGTFIDPCIADFHQVWDYTMTFTSAKPFKGGTVSHNVRYDIVDMVDAVWTRGSENYTNWSPFAWVALSGTIQPVACSVKLPTNVQLGSPTFNMNAAGTRHNLVIPITTSERIRVAKNSGNLFTLTVSLPKSGIQAFGNGVINAYVRLTDSRGMTHDLNVIDGSIRVIGLTGDESYSLDYLVISSDNGFKRMDPANIRLSTTCQ